MNANANLIMADQDQVDRLAGREFKLEEFMEVVTSYKCRVCDFTSTTVPDMARHLQKNHGSTNPPPKSLSSEPGVAKHLADPEPDSSIFSDQPPELTVCNGASTTSTAPEIYEAPTFFSNLGLTSNSSTSSQGTGSPRSIVSPALPDPKVLTNQMRSVAKNLPVIASSQSDLHVLSINSSTGTQGIPITSFQLTSAGLTLASTATTLETISAPLVDNPKDLGTGPTSIAPVTKEMFLCGVCNLDFSSIDECKTHMTQNHQGSMEDTGVSDTIVDKFEQRISVGTQATGKRPGRKRKSEMPPPLSPPMKKEIDPKVQDDDNDEDWIPGRSLSSGGRDGRQRRKIRAPKALKEDYITERKRKYRKRQMVVKETLRLECNFMGCPLKFRSQEALDIHHECHNKEDDAFTCPHCHEAFVYWKPLRIHLHRQHNVDCDMYQCDTCTYKTDTHHKLAVHCEIHSEDRPYTCDVCGKGFKQLSQMKNHQLTHVEHQRSGRGTWFSNKTCEVCKRTFANSKCLKKHVEAVHGQNKPFKCRYCSHSTAWKAMIVLHERTHTGEKPFKCDVCAYATGDHNSLRRHKMRHTGQRQYKCQLCPYTCIQTISLKTHMRNKHPNAEGVVYTCQLCKFRTINKQIYDNHIEDHRNGLISENKLDTVSSSQAPFTVTIDNVGSGVSVVPEETVQFQLQVKKMDTGELHANKEDIDRLNSIPQLVNSGMDANQLIYSAINIGSQVEGSSYTIQLLNGVQCAVCTSFQSAKGVAASYTITFQAPQILTAQPHSNVVVDLQSLTGTESMAEGVNETSEANSQGMEQNDVVLTLAGVPQEILYTEVEGMIEHSKDSGEALQVPVQNSDMEMLQDPNRGPLHGENGVEKVAENFATPSAVIVSQAGMDGVIPNVIVMDSSQAVQSMLQGEAVVEGDQMVIEVIKEDGEMEGGQIMNEIENGTQNS